MERSPPNNSPLGVRKTPRPSDTKRKQEPLPGAGYAGTFQVQPAEGERSRKAKESPARCNRSGSRKEPYLKESEKPKDSRSSATSQPQDSGSASDAKRSKPRKQTQRSLCIEPCRLEKTMRERLLPKSNLTTSARPQERIRQSSKPSGNLAPASSVPRAQSPAKFPVRGACVARYPRTRRHSS